MSACTAGAQPEWAKYLNHDLRGRLTRSVSNVALILKNSTHFGGTLAYHESECRIFWIAAPEFDVGLQPPTVGETVADQHIAYVQAVLLTQYGLSLQDHIVWGAIYAVAHTNKVQPARGTDLTFQEAAIENIIAECHGRALKAGWYNDPVTGAPFQKNVGEMNALIHSEVSEMLEGARKGLPSEHIEGFTNEEEEAADVLIRLADYSGYRKLRLAQAYLAKLAYNAQRADHKPENRAKAGGKSF